MKFGWLWRLGEQGMRLGSRGYGGGGVCRGIAGVSWEGEDEVKGCLTPFY
jgi:hypothetical protein